VTDSNHEARFKQVAMPHLDAAYNLARWLTGNSEDAEDVTQEAFLRAFKFFDGFRGEDARTWLLKIVRNTYYTQWRRARLRDESTEFDEDLHSLGDDDAPGAMGRLDANPESIVSRGEDIRMLDRALEELPVEYREALVLREIEDLSYKEIAAAMEVPIGTVMSRIARGRRLLLESFKRLGGENHGLQRSQSPASRIR
jgi:RNA polymerase sigma factor (sigma-70 family)